MEIELPYQVEYAKSGRASCKGCKTNIGQGSLRIAVMVQSAFHDGKQPNWHHEACFFKKQRPKSVGDMGNFENLRFEDQKKLEKKIAEADSQVGKKRANAGNQDFTVEYAKSGRAECRGCNQKILKDQVRIGKTVFDTEVGMKYGGQTLWHHVECFAQLRTELEWPFSGDALPGFKSLNADDKETVKKELPAMAAENGAKKPKLEKQDEADKENEKLMQKQLKKLFKFRDNVKKSMKKSDIIEFLIKNNQTPVEGDSEKLLDQIADMLTFGALLPCPECKGTQILFQKSGYLCHGDLTEWTKCTKSMTDPGRTKCKISKVDIDEFPFLKDVGKKTETRIIRYIPPSAATIAKSIGIKKEEEGPKVVRKNPPLYNFVFAQIGLKEFEKDLKQRIGKLGGALTTKLNENTTAVFSTTDEVKKLNSRMRTCKEYGIHIIPMDLLDVLEGGKEDALGFINSMSICDWGTDASKRVRTDTVKSNGSKSIYTKSVPKAMTLKIKDGLAVDPDSGLEDVAHVYVKEKDKYNAVLGLTDIQSNKNKYYKLQLLESDSKNRYWVFRSWGRIGTTIGGNKLEKCSTLIEAKQLFDDLYYEKSGNHFYNRHNFQKVPRCMYPIDIDYVDDEDTNVFQKESVPSKLAVPIQDLIKLIFDVNTMKSTMLEFHLDMEKMPLGKLSQKQIKSAYEVLSEIANLITENADNSQFIGVSNRFYTLIPHNFGVDKPPILNSKEQVEKLRDMLDSLMEIECAYNLLKTGDSSNEDAGDVNPVDKYYAQLKADMQPIDKESEEFKLLQTYAKNTHASTHNMYDLKIVNIFKVQRQGEARRFKPFKKLHNRKLLWHGSRLTNFAGILSHGLKIAPPEAPVTGYMFGKGIYFADMISKSANYCCTSNVNPTGLMLLSEVALGDMLECTNAKYITSLPKDKHSCLGRGRTQPNPKQTFIRPDGVEIPLGNPVTDDKLQTALLYNEYIVYDIAQVNIQYLFQMEFVYKY